MISSNTPGQAQTSVIRDPCSPSATATSVSTFTDIYTFSNVTVSMPDGTKVTGGLLLTVTGTATSLTSSGTTVGTSLTHWSLTGTYGLLGLSGVGESASTVITVGSTVTSSSAYAVQSTGVA